MKTVNAQDRIGYINNLRDISFSTSLINTLDSYRVIVIMVIEEDGVFFINSNV